MPSVSGKQHRFMEMVAHNPAAAKRVGVPQSVGQDFVNADKGKAMSGYAKGGNVRSTSYAAGGPVLGRTRDFLKEPDEFRDDASLPDAEDQNYGKSGPNKGSGCYPAPKARANKTIK